MPPTLDQLRERYGKEPEPDDPRKDIARTDVGLYTHTMDPLRRVSWCGLDAMWMEARGARWAPVALDPTCPHCLAAMGKVKVDPMAVVHKRVHASNGRLQCGFVGPKSHRMDDWKPGGGWTFEPAKVTCPSCLAVTTSQDPLNVIHVMSKEMPRMECGYIKPSTEPWGKGGGWSKGYARGGTLNVTCVACRETVERSGVCVDCGHPIGHPSGCTCVADAMARDAREAREALLTEEMDDPDTRPTFGATDADKEAMEMLADILPDEDETKAKPEPVGKCPKCHSPVYVHGGFCGVCHPGRL